MAEEEELKPIDESKINYKAICCENIPELFLDKLVAKSHFNKYGKITRFILRPSRLSCTVEFETEAQAAHALMEGDDYNGHSFTINYAVQEVGHVQNTEEWVGDADVMAELDAMSGGPTKTVMKNSGVSQAKASAAPNLFAQFKKPDIKSFVKSKPAPTEQRQPLPSNIPAVSISNSQKNELEAILRMQTRSDDDKLQVLEARDKLIRLNMVKITNIKMAKKIEGFCPDMCPEKERILRSIKGLVTNFERSDSGPGISHKIAVKEYSRSSATKETPLPHELRPVSVLNMTMIYLTHFIMDLCDDSETAVQDWFHFCWDRTRAIRSDLTQQEICSLGAVELFEQCARFHIHCGARLIEEEPAVFDKKINGDNLVKSLQTLKYLYHDLRVKNISCPREPEFRSYVVLINLGDANYLADIKDLPQHIQDSKEMRRALRFYNALQTNNFARFFRMIQDKETTYLEACVLVGYVVKFRENALEAIVKAYGSVRNQTVPLDFFIRNLGFEDADEAIDFLGFYGLQCDENDRVVLTRLQPPEYRYTPKRAIKLVESKRTTSVGECIYGSPLPSLEEFEKHIPHDSFDRYGFLKLEAWNADDQLRGDAKEKRLLKLEAKSEQLKKLQSEEQRLQRELREQQKKLKQQRLQEPLRTNQPQSLLSGVANKATAYFGKEANDIFKVPQPSLPRPQQEPLDKFIQPLQASTQAFGSSTFGASQLQRDPRLAASKKLEFPLASPTSTTNTASATNAPPAFGTSVSIFGGQGPAAKPASPLVAKSLGEAEASGCIFSTAARSSNQNGNIFGTSASSSIFSKRDSHSSNPPLANIFGLKQATHENSSSSQQQQQSGMQAKADQSAPSIFGRLGAVQTRTFGEQQNLFNAFGNNVPNQSAAVRQRAEDDEKSRQALLEAERQRDEKRLHEMELERQRRQAETEAMEKRKALEEAEAERQRQAALEATRREEERKAKIIALHKGAAIATQEILDSYMEESVQAIAMQELRAGRAFESSCQQLSETFLLECLEELARNIVAKELAAAFRQQTLMRRYFGVWLSSAIKARQRRQLMECTPLRITSESLQDRTENLRLSTQGECLRLIKRYRHGEPCDFKKLLFEGSDVPTAPISIHKIIAKNVGQKLVRHGCVLQSRKYVKLIFTLPGEREELPGFESLCNSFLAKNLQLPQPVGQEKGSPYICSLDDNVALCVRKLSGFVALNESGERVRHEGDHADGLLCFMTCDNLSNTRRRLHHLLTCSHLSKPLPVAFLVYDRDYDESQLVESLELAQFLDSERLKGYKFFGCQRGQSSEQQFRHSLKQALHFIAHNCEYDLGDDALEMQSFENWLESNLGEEMWRRWHLSFLKNPAFAKICTMFQHVVGLYNEAVQRLQLMTSMNLEELSDFPAELRDLVPKVDASDLALGLPYFPENWKNLLKQQELLVFLQKLLLPPVDAMDTMPLSLEGMQLWLLDYAGLCIPHNSLKSVQACHAAIKALVEQLNRPDLKDLPVDERFQFVNYLLVVKALVFCHVNVAIEEQHYSRPRHVFYKRQALHAYQEAPWWLNYKPVKAVVFVGQSVADVSSSEAATHDESEPACDEEFESIVMRAQQIIAKNEKLFKAIEAEQKGVAKKLNCSQARKLDECLERFEREQCDELCDANEAFFSDIGNDLDNMFPVDVSPEEFDELLSLKSPENSGLGDFSLSLGHLQSPRKRASIHCDLQDNASSTTDSNQKRLRLERENQLHAMLENEDKILANALNITERLKQKNKMNAHYGNALPDNSTIAQDG